MKATTWESQERTERKVEVRIRDSKRHTTCVIHDRYVIAISKLDVEI